MALEALKAYLRRTARDVEELLAFAQINRVKRIMEPYLESLM